MRRAVRFARPLALLWLLSGSWAEARPKAAEGDEWSEASIWQTVEVPGGAGGIVVLRTKAKPQRYIPIFIGLAEYLSISSRLGGTPLMRPMTHDLIERIIEELGAKLVKVHIERVKPLRERDGGTFFARVFVRRGKQIFDLDARASDSIAMALRAKAPIFVAGAVLKAAGREAKDFDFNDDVEQPSSRSKRHSLPVDPL